MADSELLEPSTDPNKRVIGYRNVVCQNPAGGARTVGNELLDVDPSQEVRRQLERKPRVLFICGTGVHGNRQGTPNRGGEPAGRVEADSEISAVGSIVEASEVGDGRLLLVCRGALKR